MVLLPLFSGRQVGHGLIKIRDELLPGYLIHGAYGSSSSGLDHPSGLIQEHEHALTVGLHGIRQGLLFPVQGLAEIYADGSEIAVDAGNDLWIVINFVIEHGAAGAGGAIIKIDEARLMVFGCLYPAGD